MNNDEHKRKILVLSHVHPFPGSAGQQQRVKYKLRALREEFHVTFLGFAPRARAADLQKQLAEHCDEVVLLESIAKRNALTSLWHFLKGKLYVARTGLKYSNYIIGKVEFTAARLGEFLQGKSYDACLVEYFHSWEAMVAFREAGIPTVVDMHNVLWKSHARNLKNAGISGGRLDHLVAAYKAAEEGSWHAFDALIAINRGEESYAREVVGSEKKIFYSPMGVDLSLWPFSQTPTDPPRVAYYGGLGSPHNAADAMDCFKTVMPEIWKERPETEFWIVGSNPPPAIKELESDQRVHVTGFVEDAAAVLKSMTAVLCPWSGTYGFRSRVVEVMALGVPVVATEEAVYGMEMEDGKGIFLRDRGRPMAEAALKLLLDEGFRIEQSNVARAEMERLYGYDACYLRLAREIGTWCSDAKVSAAASR